MRKDHEASDIQDVHEPVEIPEYVSLTNDGEEVGRVGVPEGWTRTELREHLEGMLDDIRQNISKEEPLDNYRQIEKDEYDTITEAELFRRGFSYRMVQQILTDRETKRINDEARAAEAVPPAYPCAVCAHSMDVHRRKNSESWLGCTECTCDVYRDELIGVVDTPLPDGFSREVPTGPSIFVQDDTLDEIEWVTPIEHVADDPVNHPAHYTAYPGIEIIQLTRRMNFNRGNAVKYIARAGLKDPSKEVEDLEKAIFYLTDEVTLLKGEFD